MAAKGNIAKTNVLNTIKSAFGPAYLGEFDKKAYVLVDDGGTKVQVAISLTCPKVPVEAVGNTGVRNFEDEDSPVLAVSGYEAPEITDEERQRVNDLMARLGL